MPRTTKKSKEDSEEKSREPKESKEQEPKLTKSGKPRKKRASAGIKTEKIEPERSRVQEMRTGVQKEAITVDIDGDPGKPVAFIEDHEEVVPHSHIPKRLKDSIIEAYSERFFLEQEWTRGQLIRLSRALSYPRENVTRTIAQICGPSCTFKDLCPYDIAGRPPIGARCPIEIHKSQQLYNEYIKAVSERLKMDPDEIRSDIILHNLINGLVEADMVEDRLNGSIAEDGFLTEVPAVINEQTGEVFNKQEESVAVRIKERVARRKDQLFRQLLATPEMAEKYRRGEDADTVAKKAKVIEQMEKLLKNMEEKTITDGETRE